MSVVIPFGRRGAARCWICKRTPAFALRRGGFPVCDDCVRCVRRLRIQGFIVSAAPYSGVLSRRLDTTDDAEFFDQCLSDRLREELGAELFRSIAHIFEPSQRLRDEGKL